MIVEALVDPHTTHVEGVGISTEDSPEEKRDHKSTLEMGFDTSSLCSIQISEVISHFSFFLAIGHHYSDGIQSLLSIASTLPIRLHVLLEASLHYLSDHTCCQNDDRHYS